MDKLLLENIGVKELSSSELQEINGGDDFMRMLGGLIGQAGGYIKDAVQWVGNNCGQQMGMAKC